MKKIYLCAQFCFVLFCLVSCAGLNQTARKTGKVLCKDVGEEGVALIKSGNEAEIKFTKDINKAHKALNQFVVFLKKMEKADPQKAVKANEIFIKTIRENGCDELANVLSE
jgi:hypothetical protein